MTYTKKQFLEDVAKEARALKEHATKEELAKLDFTRLNSRQFNLCVYGQICGSCFSRRAADLIHACCPRYFQARNDDEVSLEEYTEEGGDAIDYVNGTKVSGVKNSEDLYEARDGEALHYSSIEAYIMLPDAQNANLIAFLKGETNDLVL